jgi:hypothetical protein
MPSIQATAIDCPTCYAVTVVNLFQRNTRRSQDIFHAGSVLNSNVGIGIERFNEDTPTPVCQAREHKSSRIIDTEQPSLNADTSGEK